MNETRRTGNEAIANVVICYTLGGSLKVLVTVHT